MNVYLSPKIFSAFQCITISSQNELILIFVNMYDHLHLSKKKNIIFNNTFHVVNDSYQYRTRLQNIEKFIDFVFDKSVDSITFIS